MSSNKPVRGRPNNKVRRAVKLYRDLMEADELLAKATELQAETEANFRTALVVLNEIEMNRYVKLASQLIDGEVEEL